MSTPIKRKWISWDELADLWEHMRRGKWNAIAPGLADDLQEIWKHSVMEVFTNRKSEGTYGKITIEDLNTYINRVNFGQGGRITSLPKKGYLSKYDFKNEYTYVKYGELRFLMRQNRPYQKHEFSGSNRLRVRIDIPDKEYDKNTDGYRHLEADRSFIKASFVLSWPIMLNKIIETISDV